MSEPFESQLRKALEQHAERVPDEAYERLREIDYHPRSPASRVALGLAALATLAAAVGISLSLIGFGGGPQRAFAGWTPDPTAPQPGQIAAAEGACKTRVATSVNRSLQRLREMHLYEERRGHHSIHPPTGISGAWRTILADTRGPYTLVMLTNGEGDFQCLVGTEPSRLAGFTGEWPSRSGVSVGPDQIGALSLGLTRASNGKPFKYVSGRAGTGVRAVRIVLAHGRRISATVAHGWYLAWWPGAESVTSLEVISAHGESTQQVKQ